MGELLEGLLEFAARQGEMTSNIQELITSLLELANTMEVVHAAFEKTWATVETGARLQGLSSVTGESVGKLYEFERGLDAVGRKAKYLPTVFADMQRALSATGEKGDRMSSLFDQLGLNIGQLRKEDTADAVLQVAGALGKQDKNTATGLGSQIFGRFQTETVLAIARNMDLFRQVMDESSSTASILEKNSKTFQNAEIGRSRIDNNILGSRASVAGMIAPDLASFMQSGPVDESLFDIAGRRKFERYFSRLPGVALDGLDASLSNSGGIDSGSNHFKPGFTSLEKMGFIMSGAKVQNPYDQRKVDLLQQIANNTATHAAAAINLPPLGNTYMGIYSPMIHEL